MDPTCHSLIIFLILFLFLMNLIFFACRWEFPFCLFWPYFIFLVSYERKPECCASPPCYDLDPHERGADVLPRGNKPPLSPWARALKRAWVPTAPWARLRMRRKYQLEWMVKRHRWQGDEPVLPFSRCETSRIWATYSSRGGNRSSVVVHPNTCKNKIDDHPVLIHPTN